MNTIDTHCNLFASLCESRIDRGYSMPYYILYHTLLSYSHLFGVTPEILHGLTGAQAC